MNQQKSNITFEDFNKVDIRMCKILSVEKIEKADKLYKLTIDTGFDNRVVVSAIAHVFNEDDLQDSYMPFVLNLEPRKIRGIESNGMIILCETKNTKRLFPLGISKEEMFGTFGEDDDFVFENEENDLIGSIII